MTADNVVAVTRHGVILKHSHVQEIIVRRMPEVSPAAIVTFTCVILIVKLREYITGPSGLVILVTILAAIDH
jgi:hypothetical protein